MYMCGVVVVMCVSVCVQCGGCDVCVFVCVCVCDWPALS